MCFGHIPAGAGRVYDLCEGLGKAVASAVVVVLEDPCCPARGVVAGKPLEEQERAGNSFGGYRLGHGVA